MLKWTDVLAQADGNHPKPERRVEKTDAEWRAQLPNDAYYVTRQAGTERPFSSEMCSRFEPGIYACKCCGTRLFDSATKFESGTGWPSFTAPIKDNVVAYHTDRSHGMVRVETVCSTCDAHLGHVFPDGPAPTGLRFCMNALALDKVSDS
jgi:peptide-methionine (R)-S-oxide reductase